MEVIVFDYGHDDSKRTVNMDECAVATSSGVLEKLDLDKHDANKHVLLQKTDGEYFLIMGATLVDGRLVTTGTFIIPDKLTVRDIHNTVGKKIKGNRITDVHIEGDFALLEMEEKFDHYHIVDVLKVFFTGIEQSS